MNRRFFKSILITITILCSSSNLAWAQQSYTQKFANGMNLYTQDGADPTWKSILDNKLIPINSNSTKGITGSKISVKKEMVEKGPYSTLSIENDINIHTLGNSVIQRDDFNKWSRWYQEDRKTQAGLIQPVMTGKPNCWYRRLGRSSLENLENL